MFARLYSRRAAAATAAAFTTAAAAAFHGSGPASSEQGSLVANWADPAKARRLEKNYQNPEVVAQRSAMRELLQPQRGERVLDVGCGPGLMMQELSDEVGPTGQVAGVDPAEIMIDLARARLANVVANPAAALQIAGAEELPYADESFDAVVLSQVLLYVPDIPRALLEAKRVLRPGGRVLICDTDWDSLIVELRYRTRRDVATSQLM